MSAQRAPAPPATAPYNFVPLPNKVLSVVDDASAPWRQHDQLRTDLLQGWIVVQFTVLTPLAIGDGLRPNDPVGRDGRRRATRSRQDIDGNPIIPGSSWRGMVRTLGEILSFSAVRPVAPTVLHYRSIGPDGISRQYLRDRKAGPWFQREGGLVHKHGSTWSFVPHDVRRCPLKVVEALCNSDAVNAPSDGAQRVPFSDITDRGNVVVAGFYKPKPELDRRGIAPFPGSVKLAATDRPLNGAPCLVQLDDAGAVSGIRVDELIPEPEWQSGTLVLTGWAPTERGYARPWHFVFTPKTAPADDDRNSICPKVIEAFHDQITDYQAAAYPDGGQLQSGDPVFVRRGGDGKIDALGRTPFFRLPHRHSTLAAIGEVGHALPLDMARTIFGTLDTPVPIRSRLRFEDALAVQRRKPVDGWYLPERSVSLLSPHPGYAPHYLEQPAGANTPAGQLTSYSHDSPRARGHKLYRHRAVEASTEAEGGTATTLVPVAPGVVFVGRLWFMNLSREELGLLLAALEIDPPNGIDERREPRYAHKLGAARALGYGSVHLATRLHLFDPDRRYGGWSDDGARTDTVSVAAACRRDFSTRIARHATDTDEKPVGAARTLTFRNISRLHQMRAILAFGDVLTNPARQLAVKAMDTDGYSLKRPLPPASSG